VWQVQDSNLRHRLYQLACLVDYRRLPFIAVPQRIPPMNIPPAIPPVTVPARIRRLTDRRWRPQDVGWVEKITLALGGVGLRHRRALASAPADALSLAAACPACNARRRTAPTRAATVCGCQCCKSTLRKAVSTSRDLPLVQSVLGPERFVHLSTVLGLRGRARAAAVVLSRSAQSRVGIRPEHSAGTRLRD
jgi:hypothetical protein